MGKHVEHVIVKQPQPRIYTHQNCDNTKKNVLFLSKQLSDERRKMMNKLKFALCDALAAEHRDCMLARICSSIHCWSKCEFLSWCVDIVNFKMYNVVEQKNTERLSCCPKTRGSVRKKHNFKYWIFASILNCTCSFSVI